ncbi:hypothetical protein [Mesorhizobium sp. M0965]|uniref:hypothetical protein n=1 Tax=unclassified Mesorhizobium TaxID=325217 RepID=UPI00333715F5
MPQPDVLLFNFKSDVPRLRRDELLATIEGWSEVKAAQYLNPTAKRAETARMGYVELTEGADTEAVGRKLSELVEVEMTQEPARRGL